MTQLPSASDGHWNSQTLRKIRIGEMPVHKMKFVVVNNMAPRNPSVCTECSHPLERSYIPDLSSSKRYCADQVLPLDGNGR